MMSWRTAIIGAVVVSAIVIAWKLVHPSHKYRFRLTVEVIRDGVSHSGQSVIELRTTRNTILSLLSEVPSWSTSVRGEAVFVELGGNDHLIALLTSDNQPGPTALLPSRAILGDVSAYSGPAGVLDKLSTREPQALREAMGKSFLLTTKQLPPLVHFKQIDDPTSVERIDPDNPAEGYGSAVGPVRVHLEITRDPVTTGLLKKLPWLVNFRKDKGLDGRDGTRWRAGQLPFSSPEQMSYTNFIAER